MSKIVWLSLDPVKAKLDFYPNFIAYKIEEAYMLDKENINLGVDFYNATINFKSNEQHFQTTPGAHLGCRFGYKQPGFRTIKRIETDEDNISIMGKRIYGEWRITNNNDDVERTFNSKIPLESIIDKHNINGYIDKPKYWKADDLEDDNKLVVVWCWCKSTNYNDSSFYNLSDNWWIPYLQHQNEQIELAYTNDLDNIEIIIPFDSSKRYINFIPSSHYGKQKDITNFRTRIIKRVVISINKLKEIMNNTNNTNDNDETVNFINDDNIPNEYLCPISQQIMKDPVYTIDNHVYDRLSIERWFEEKHTSPLTGLYLTNISLTPNEDLKKKIKDYIEKIKSSK